MDRGMLLFIVTWLNKKIRNNLVGLWYQRLFLGTTAVVAMFYLAGTRDVNLNN
jgi:hypothetical protein